MDNKKIKKEFRKLRSSTLNFDTFADRFKDGIIYTLYSDKSNSLQVGFAENDRVLATKLSSEALILLDTKKGTKKELILLINILNELGIKSLDNLNYRYSTSIIRHLSTLGWPIGRSLFKQRKIKKELLCA